jgi:hypothetical protein
LGGGHRLGFATIWIVVLVTVPVLTLKRIGRDDFAVTAGHRAAGRIMAKPKAFGESVWFWTITGPHIPASLLPSNGETQSFEAAKVSFKAKFEAVFALADCQGEDVQWVGDLPQSDSC